jgi:hypothetical protein
MKSTRAQLLLTLLAIVVALVAIHSYTPHNRIVAPEGCWFVVARPLDAKPFRYHFDGAIDLCVDRSGWLCTADGELFVPGAVVPSDATELHLSSDGGILCRSTASADWTRIGDIMFLRSSMASAELNGGQLARGTDPIEMDPPGTDGIPELPEMLLNLSKIRLPR